jgi:hypothetical protein
VRDIAEIRDLSVRERLQLVGEIWNGVKLPVDDDQSTDSVEVLVVRQQGELMLKAERGNPQIVFPSGFSFGTRPKPAKFRSCNARVKLRGQLIRPQERPLSRNRVNGSDILAPLVRKLCSYKQLSENGKGKKYFGGRGQLCGFTTISSQKIDRRVCVSRQSTH